MLKKAKLVAFTGFVLCFTAIKQNRIMMEVGKFDTQATISDNQHAPSSSESGVVVPLQSSPKQLSENQITVVVLTADEQRFVDLQGIAKVALNHSLVWELVIIWNEPSKPEGAAHLKKQLPQDARIRILQSSKNTLNNRYDPHLLQIQTGAIMILDDDLTIIPDTITCAHESWMNNKSLLHSMGDGRQVYLGHYGTRRINFLKDQKQPNFLLPRMIFHRSLLDVYFDPTHAAIRQYVDSQEAHCDDIAFASVISKHLGAPLVSVPAPHGERNSQGRMSWFHIKKSDARSVDDGKVIKYPSLTATTVNRVGSRRDCSTGIIHMLNWTMPTVTHFQCSYAKAVALDGSTKNTTLGGSTKKATSKVKTPTSTKITTSKKKTPTQQQKPAAENSKGWSSVVSSIPLGWDNDDDNERDSKGLLPEWVQALCPAVVEHYTKFPSFSKIPNVKGKHGEMVPLPISTTVYAAKGVCTYHIAQHVAAAKANAHLYLHAGSHLGAVLHGQPIPWDDDTDCFMNFEKLQAMKEACAPGIQIYPNVTLRCHDMEINKLKIWVQQDGDPKMTKCHHPLYKGIECPHYSPFLDVFLYQLDSNKIWEVPSLGRKVIKHTFPLEEYFPVVPYYYGGILAYGPRAILARKRYNFDKCFLSEHNHRHDNRSMIAPIEVECSPLKQKFPFRTSYNELRVADDVHHIFGIPESESAHPPLLVTTISQRRQWYQQPGLAKLGQNITNQLLPELNQVEVDNTIAPAPSNNGTNGCTLLQPGRLKVLEFNAERGRWWKESLDKLRGYDLILLNEVDIGMARSDQQHTTRNLAHALQMNYAWGLEFVELTPGDATDRRFVPPNSNNLYGLHGNAILARCPILDPILLRDELGDYFSDKKMPRLNANGLEKRLGGRMGMFARIQIDHPESNGDNKRAPTPLVIGSVHKLDLSQASHIVKYIGSDHAVIAGDQPAPFCPAIQTRNVLSKEHTNFKASCSSTGKQQGDIICSNLPTVTGANTILPCAKEFGIGLALSDHAFTWAEFQL